MWYICTMRYSWYIVLLLSVVVSACRKDLHDDNKPVAEIVSPVGGTYSDTLSFQLNFNDNKNLFQYRLAISFAGTYDTNDSAIAKPFNYVWIEKLDGSAVTENLSIFISDSAATGPYRAVLTCVDEAGLESPADTILFTILNKVDNGLPDIAISSPTNGGDYTDSLYVLALLTDQSNIVYYAAELIDSTNSSKKQLFNYFNTSGFAVDTMMYFQDLPAGHYTFKLTARDTYYNINTSSTPVILH